MTSHSPVEGLTYQRAGHSEGQDLHGHSLEVRGPGWIAALSSCRVSGIMNHLYVQTMERVPFPTRFFRPQTHVMSKWRTTGFEREAAEAGQ